MQRVIEEVSLQEFTASQMNFLQGLDNKDVLDVAGYFDFHISKAREELALAERRLISVSEESPHISDPFHGGGNEEELDRVRLNVVRFNKKLTCLLNRKKDFLVDPLGYQNCSSCGAKIPKERMEEVPQCRHCVACKNHSHNGCH